MEERIDGLDQVRIMDRTGESTHIEFPEKTYTAYIQFDPEFNENSLRLAYTSMTTPWTDFDYHIDTGELEVRKVQEIPSGYKSSKYVTHRELASARDGVQVPVSIVRHKDTPVDGLAPLYIYAYAHTARHFPVLFHRKAVLAGPGLHIRHRPYPGRRRPGIPLVRGGQPVRADQHFQ